MGKPSAVTRAVRRSGVFWRRKRTAPEVTGPRRPSCPALAKPSLSLGRRVAGKRSRYPRVRSRGRPPARAPASTATRRPAPTSEPSSWRGKPDRGEKRTLARGIRAEVLNFRPPFPRRRGYMATGAGCPGGSPELLTPLPLEQTALDLICAECGRSPRAVRRGGSFSLTSARLRPTARSVASASSANRSR
jgi:hypothetical protein